MRDVMLESTLTCPACGHQERETMPVDACQYLYECASCHALHKPKAGDCCVYCSYGSVPCPPKQLEPAPGKKQAGGKPECCR
jgi:hypothetical protein